MASNAIFHSDHRASFVDFNSELLFSDPAYEISPAKYRRLSMYDPRLVEQYHTKLHE
jgi:hypothetical protein